MESIVLEEKIDPNYELSEEDYQEYIESLGIVLPEDKDLLHIAHEALKAQLPAEWKPCQTQDGQIYYFNFQTGESVWDHPVDLLYREKVQKAKKLKKSKGLNRQQKNSQLSDGRSNKNLEQMKFVALKNSDSEGSASSECKFQQKARNDEELIVWVQSFAEECEEKKENERKLIQTGLEERKNKLLAQAKSKEEDLRKTCKEKIEILRNQLNKDLEKQAKGLKDEILNKISQDVQEFEAEYRQKAEAQKIMILNQNDEQKFKKQFNEKSVSELSELQKTLEKYREKHDREVQIGSKLKDFYLEKLEKSKSRLLKAFEIEKNQLKVKEIIEDPPNFLTKSDQEYLIQSKNDFASKFLKFQTDLRLKNSSELQILQQKLTEKRENYLQVQQKKEKLEKEVFASVQKSQQDLEASLESYRQEKLKELKEKLENFRLKNQENDSASLVSKVSSLESELVSIKATIFSKTAELDSLTAECKVLQSEIDQMTIKKQGRGLSEVSIFSENESPISKKQFVSIVSDLGSLKQSVFRSIQVEDREKVDQSVNLEKNRIRAVKKKLFMDRELWQNNLKDFRASPSKTRYSELLEQKKILDQKIKWHNWRVRELKILEKFIKNGNFGLGIEMMHEDNARVDTEVYGKSIFDNDFKNKRVVLCE